MLPAWIEACTATAQAATAGASGGNPRPRESTMLKQGVIEPDQSPCASNLVLVRKKDGTLR